MVGRPQPLSKFHDLSQFDCGKEILTDWLKKHALQSQASGHTKTMVITDDSNSVVGYYSFSVVSVEHVETTPDRVKKGLARYSIPVFLIARLAVDKRLQGTGLGRRLLRHALLKAAKAAQHNVPLRAVVVDAIDPQARDFYAQSDFKAWPIDSFRMWILMKDLIASFDVAEQRRRKSEQTF